jgi:tRNA dimethylallyltransferase
MLYFRVLDQGLSELPGANAVVRARLDEVRVIEGPEALHRRLQAVDPESASRIHPNDPQRLQRALEVYEVTGRSLTEWHLRQRPEKCPYRVLKLVVTPAERATLHRRIEVRFHRMLEQGFVAEVRRLRARGDLSLNNVSMRAVGYRQVWDYLDGLTDYATMVQRGLAATRQLAKRQLTWLRSEPRAMSLDSLAPGLIEQAVAQIDEARFFPE